MHIDLAREIGGFSAHIITDFPLVGITAIAGPSGAGKTTVLRMIAGFAHGRGQLSVQGRVLQDETRFTPAHQRQFGYVAQAPGLFSHLSVRQNLEFALRRARSGGPDLPDIAARFGIEDLLDRMVGRLSGGEAQRVALARAILAHPRLLLLDEPFSALDEEGRGQLIVQLRHILQDLEIPALMVVHEFSTLCQLADHVLYIDQGRAIHQGPLAAALMAAELPFAGRVDACVMVPAVLGGGEAAYQLSQLCFGEHCLMVPLVPGRLGDEVRVRIRAGDVSISREQISGSSIVNSLPVRVSELRTTGERPGQVLVVLGSQGMSFLARITAKSVAELGLETGDTVFAQIKASAAIGV